MGNALAPQSEEFGQGEQKKRLSSSSASLPQQAPN